MPLINEQLGILTKCGGSDSQEMATEILAARKKIAELEWFQQERQEVRSALSVHGSDLGTAPAARGVMLRLEELERITHQACPCLHTTPCHERCTCVNGFYSTGCRRCCSYGSLDQRKMMAHRLVENEKQLRELAYCSNQDCPHSSLIASIPCVFCRNKAHKVRIELLEKTFKKVLEKGDALKVELEEYDPQDNESGGPYYAARLEAIKVLEST